MPGPGISLASGYLMLVLILASLKPLEKIVFVQFTSRADELYRKLMHLYFPLQDNRGSLRSRDDDVAQPAAVILHKENKNDWDQEIR